MDMKRVTVVRPSYFPSITTIARILASPTVVYGTLGRYHTDQGMNTALIGNGRDVTRLHVPVKGQNGKTLELVAPDGNAWQAKHLAALDRFYASSPRHLHLRASLLVPFYEKITWDSLLFANGDLLRWFVTVLGIETTMTNFHIIDTAVFNATAYDAEVIGKDGKPEKIRKSDHPAYAKGVRPDEREKYLLGAASVEEVVTEDPGPVEPLLINGYSYHSNESVLGMLMEYDPETVVAAIKTWAFMVGIIQDPVLAC